MPRTERPTRWGKTAMYIAARLEALEGKTLESKFMRAWAVEMLAEAYKARQAGRHFRQLLDGGWIVPIGKFFRFTAGGIRAIEADRAERRVAQAAAPPPAAPDRLDEGHPVFAAPPPAAVEEAASALPGAGCTN